MFCSWPCINRLKWFIQLRAQGLVREIGTPRTPLMEYGTLLPIILVCTVSEGEIALVAGSAYDLRSPTLLGDGIPRVFGAPRFPGFDDNYCLCPCPAGDSAAATLVHRASGRLLRVFTDQPGMQVYTGNHLDGIPGKLGTTYGQHSSIALETQNYPDAIHHVSISSNIAIRAVLSIRT